MNAPNDPYAPSGNSDSDARYKSSASSPTPSDAKPPKPRKSWLRRLLPFFAILLLLLFCAPLALSLSPVRNFVAKKVSDVVGRKVDIGDASAFWFSGIELKDVTVHNPEGYSQSQPLARIEKIHTDIDLLALMGGNVEADVHITSPHVVVEQYADGRANYEGLFPQDPNNEKDPDAKPPHVSLKLENGRIEVKGGTLPPCTMTGLKAIVGMKPDGSNRADVRCTLTEAGPAREAVPIHAYAVLDANMSGPVHLTTEGKLDLSMMAPLIRSNDQVETLTGSADVLVDGSLLHGKHFEGKVRLRSEQLYVRLAGGRTLASDKMRAEVRLAPPDQDDATEKGRGYILLENVVFEDPLAEQAAPFRESKVELSVTGEVASRDALTDVQIERGHIRAGDTLHVRTAKPIHLVFPKSASSPTVEGEALVQANLGRLGALHGLVPDLKQLESGQLVARVDTRNLRQDGVGGFEIGAGAKITNLKLRPSPSMPNGFEEPNASLKLRFIQADGSPSRLHLHSLDSSVIKSRDTGSPLQVLLPRNSGASIDGPFDLLVDLSRLSPLTGASMGFTPGESMSGTITLKGRGQGTADQGAVQANVAFQQVILPERLTGSRDPLDLAGVVTLERSADSMKVSLRELAFWGCQVAGDAMFGRLGEAWQLNQGDADIRGDLASSPQLRSRLGMDPATQLAGTFHYRAQMKPLNGGGSDVRGVLQVNDFQMRTPTADAPIQEAQLRLDHAIALGPQGQRGRIDQLKLACPTIEVGMTQGSFVLEPELDIQGVINIQSQADRLVPYVKAALGEGYEDLTASGPVTGQINLRGGPGLHQKQLLMDGKLQLGTWATGGLGLSQTALTLARRTPDELMQTTFVARMNGGAIGMSGAVQLGAAVRPWVARVRLQQVDTANWIVSKGAARGMSYALPVLLPSGGDGGGGVLSGKLDADVTARANDFASPTLMNTVSGQGTVGMKDGEIKGSSLFGAGTGSSGLGKLVKVLSVVVPVAGQVLTQAAKALAFQRIDSKFRVARRMVDVEKLAVAGQALSINMKGRVGFDKRVNMDADIEFGDAAGAVKAIIPGAKIPLKIQGALDAPLVIPRLNPAELLKPGALVNLKGLLPGGGGGKSGSKSVRDLKDLFGR